tara:strand:- start:1824 stop:2504 length:681 start_codon:yes stop_codon:yes gene_type:complete
MFGKIKKHSLLILVVLLLFFIGHSITISGKLQDYKSQVIKFKNTEQVFIERINEKGEKIAEQDQIILTQNDAISHNLIEIETLKKIKSQVQIKTITKIDSVFIPILDTIERVIYDTSGLALLKLPTKFGLNNEWYSIYSTVKKEGMFIDSLSLYNRQTITFGMKSNGFLKKPTPSLVVKNDNPYVNVNSLSNVVIKNDLRFYDKKGFWYGLGVGTGILIPALLINK